MCEFLSALVLSSGDIILDPEHTDGHEDLIEENGLLDHGRGFVRVEFDGDHLTLDEDCAPEWWNEDLAVRVEIRLRSLIEKHTLVNIKKPILLGGWWILKDCDIARVKNARIVRANNCDFGSISNSRIDDIRNSCVSILAETFIEEAGNCKIGTRLNSTIFWEHNENTENNTADA